MNKEDITRWAVLVTIVALLMLVIQLTSRVEMLEYHIETLKFMAVPVRVAVIDSTGTYLITQKVEFRYDWSRAELRK